VLLKKLGKYDIIEWLGGGRFGDVFLARDTLLDKEFALKISRMRKEEIAMLKDEAKLLASLNHPNIVRFYNIDIIDSKFVMVMECVKGKTLRDIITDEGIPVDSVIDLIGQILDAVRYAHEFGVLHRDIKPENILLAQTDDRYHVKITDFGLARFIKSGSLSASTAGTPVYMAPEAWSGNYTERSDIWSIAALAYEMLTGVPPFLADDLNTLSNKITKGRFLLPAVIKTTIPEYVEDAIVKGLAINPLSRPSAQELMEMLFRQHGAVKVRGVLSVPKKEPTQIDLTRDQTDILAAIDGQVLVSGQAGCGKTTTLTYAVYSLLQKGIPGSHILVTTFTNKSASDVRERLSQLAAYPSSDLWIGTFHTIGLRMLRRDIERLDISEEFRIMHPKQVFPLLKLKTGQHRSNAIMRFIGLLKARGITPGGFTPSSTWEKTCLAVYGTYQQYMFEHSILDYDDLILYAVQLLEEHDDIRQFYQHRFRYVFVDEVQDISPAQNRLIKLCVQHNVFFTGDSDQAIYGWRGADRSLMNQLAKQYGRLKTFSLTKSFRLPQGVLDIANNLMLRVTTAIPTTSTGEVLVYGAKSDKDEAKYVAAEIRRLKEEGFRFQDIAILYRMNYISRSYEEILIKSHIPHTLIAGVSFYERVDIKPIIEYLELLDTYSRTEKRTSTHDEEFKAHARECFKVKNKDLNRFLKILDYHLQNRAMLSPAHVIAEIISAASLKGENIGELIALARQHSRISLSDFLNEIRLVQELDLVDWGKDTVKLMTVHSAKGLEFPVVFVVDLVEDVFPLTKKMSSDKDIEEERRLCYVAATRAQKKLYLIYPKWRYGRYQQPSRFLVDMFKTTS
jgi:DNA helicase-2/ATP-dependent DNA helicase PcrA